jgi:hypothetical protein
LQFAAEALKYAFKLLKKPGEKMDRAKLEKYTSAITLSDMEIFVFPELMYSLVLANIMSPNIWKWREADCFIKLAGKSSYKKLLRLKQFIMDEYEFNLDLETWGLTNQKNELNRFKDFISPEDIARSNALFGYQGDKYYFDVDIRKHFGLDKYDSDIIPYWKTETVEAMDAFRLKPGYKKSAGECVSLAALYAAAAFVVCGIPFEDIYMILTPLHSQNFLDINGGVLTNNRRIVTKTMWFNGTAITTKAQRALRNEQITIVAHNSGYVHCLYDNATMDKNAYDKFNNKLNQFLSTELTTLTMANFLRCHQQYQKFFQFCCEHCRGGQKFAKAEVLFHYEHGSKFRIADDTFEKLLNEVSGEDISPYKFSDKLCCKQLQAYVEYEKLSIKTGEGKASIREYVAPFVPMAEEFANDLADFLCFELKLAGDGKNFQTGNAIELSAEQSREEIIDYLQSKRRENSTADLAFYAFRDMATCEWEPFVKAAIERNPVSLERLASMQIAEIYEWLRQMPDESIYDSARLAQPDEVVNFNTGDGLEKAFLLANAIRGKNPDRSIELKVSKKGVSLKAEKEYSFSSNKGLENKVSIPSVNEERVIECR